MSGWSNLTLGDVLELKRGYDLPTAKREAGHVPIISSSGPSDFHSEAKVEGPGVITGRYGTIGQVFFTREAFWPLNTALYVRDFKGNDPRFCYYFLKTLDWNKFNDKSGVPGVNRNDAHQEPVLLPPLAEQREIASILGALDDKIELNRRMAATLEEMARALYRSWFVDFDPVKAKAEGLAPAFMDEATAALFPDRFGDDGLPEGWEIAPLSAMCDHMKKTVKPMEAPDDAFLHFSLPAFDAGRMPVAEPGAAIKSNKTFVPHNAILFSRLNPTIPRVWWARTKGIDATPVSSTEFFIAKAHDPSETAWLYCTLSSDEFREAACARVTGTSNSHQRIPPKALAEIEVIAPSPDVVSAFGELAGPWFERIHKMATENQTLATLRDTLLPKLMSGELRVGEARDQIEEVA